MIKSIRFKRFKSFKAEQTLELRPITVIIGKNNSGKSAILKLVRMLQHSINEDKFVPSLEITKNECPLIYNCETYKYADKLDDLAYLKKLTAHPISISLWFENDNPEIHTEINTFEKLEAFKEYTIATQSWTYLEDEKKFNSTFNKSLSNLRENVVYWSALRPQLERIYAKPSAKKDKIDLQLINFVENKTLKEATQDWYQTNLSLNFDFKYQSLAQDLFSLHEIKDSTLINLADTGEGIAQTLPIVIETLKNEANTLHIVEQPELHLHPAAHASMAQLFADAVNKNNSVKFLVETHSDNFVLRLRTLCAKGLLSPKQIKLYYIEKQEGESQLTEIVIDEMGEVNWWPENVFSEAADEVMNLRIAQFTKK